VLEIRMRVGPKGQVVIPKVLRDALKIGPGSEVTFAVEGEKVVLRASRADVVDVFERIAKSGKSIGRFPPHAAYKRELRRRRA
jgi:AbrB family looped-hinge helix DNA binding protein